MKKILAKIKLWIISIYSKTDELIERIAPVAINVVEQIKTVNESTTGDVIELIITKAIKGNADDVAVNALRIKLKIYLPQVIEKMKLIMNISKAGSINAQAKAIIAAINMSPDEIKNAYYHTFAVLILEKISDGKLTWSESVQIAEYYYNNIRNVK